MPKYPSSGWKIKTAAGKVLEDNNFTTSATTYSQWYSLDDARYFGIAMKAGTVSGTTPICTPTIECNFGGDTSNVFTLPAAVNTTTEAGSVLATFSTTSDNQILWFENPLPSTGQKGQVRLKFVVSGTSPVFPWAVAKMWKVER